ncbi:MAG TPA: hypothetical protein VFI06_00500 [Chitinophagaceae bacterium]|nr:hypothetical protein [Chitinophagaceae bacterium]
MVQKTAGEAMIGAPGYFFHAFRNGNDRRQFVETAVRGVDFPTVLTQDWRSVPAETCPPAGRPIRYTTMRLGIKFLFL